MCMSPLVSGQFSSYSAYFTKNSCTSFPCICISGFTLPSSDCWIILKSMILLSFDVEHYIWKGFTASITIKTGLRCNSVPSTCNACPITFTTLLVVRYPLPPTQNLSIESRVQCTYSKNTNLTFNIPLVILKTLIHLQPLGRASSRYLSLKVSLPSERAF